MSSFESTAKSQGYVGRGGVYFGHANVMDDSLFQGSVRVYGTSLNEEVVSFSETERSFISNYGTDLTFIGLQAVQ